MNIQYGDATDLPFEDNTFDVVLNEAMLTMLNHENKEKAIKEYYRVLKPNGILLTHDVLLTIHYWVSVEGSCKKREPNFEFSFAFL